MKVVLFCGGFGLRIRDYSENIPKPMVTIGYRPILLHLMKYYAHYGHKDFILCLGYKTDVIKNYFLNYNECLSNDFILTDRCKNIELINRDIGDWKITFVDTGLHSNIGQRLMKVRNYLDGEDVFLVNYADGLTDLPLPTLIDFFYKKNKIGTLLAVTPNTVYHMVSTNQDDIVNRINYANEGALVINGGFFIFKKDIFRYIKEGEELVHEPFQRLIAEKELVAYRYGGFWASMDTFKEKQKLEEIYSRGEAPWEVWNNNLRGQDCSAHLFSRK
jgi:glucose-1-phosphate cytidylyltransferase